MATNYLSRSDAESLANTLQRIREGMQRGDFCDLRSLAKSMEVLTIAAEVAVRYILKDPDVK